MGYSFILVEMAPRPPLLEGPQRGVPVECLKVACVVERVALVVDYLNKIFLSHSLVLEKFTQLSSVPAWLEVVL